MEIAKTRLLELKVEVASFSGRLVAEKVRGVEFKNFIENKDEVNTFTAKFLFIEKLRIRRLLL